MARTFDMLRSARRPGVSGQRARPRRRRPLLERWARALGRRLGATLESPPRAAATGSTSVALDDPAGGVSPELIETWIARAAAGDDLAFSLLVSAHHSKLLRLARRRVGDASAAEDCCQEAFVSAWRAIGGFRGTADGFSAWMARIVANKCYDDQRRRHCRPREVPIERNLDGDPEHVPVPAGDRGPDAMADGLDAVEACRRALAGLSVAHRTVLLLDHDGYQYAEIAGILGVPIGTVRSRLSRARARARALMTTGAGSPATSVVVAGVLAPAAEGLERILGARFGARDLDRHGAEVQYFTLGQRSRRRPPSRPRLLRARERCLLSRRKNDRSGWCGLNVEMIAARWRPLALASAASLSLLVAVGRADAAPTGGSPEPAERARSTGGVAAPADAPEAPAGTLQGAVVRLSEQADVSGAYRLPDKASRAAFVYDRLTEVADRTQPPIADWLERRGAQVKRLWISNAVVVHADAETLRLVRLQPGVASVRPIGTIWLDDPDVPAAAPGLSLTSIMEPLATEPGLREIGADDVWRMGYEGQGIVVAVTDTGAAYRHPALRDVYRGLDGDHDYDWFDAIKGAEEPVDAHGHGTHVTGTTVGKAGSRMIGVAPQAQWISCRLIEQRSGPDSAALECLQWVMAPTKLDGSEPRPDLAPDVVNASWGGDVGKECPGSAELFDAVYNLQAAGILFVASAGNSGDGCSTVCAPGMYPPAFAVANYDTRARKIAGTSSRGPVDWDGSEVIKPEIAAPGTDINSSLPPSRYGELTGTSMAAPHVTGAVALLLSARPELRGRPEVVRGIIQDSAKYVRADRCGPGDSESGPNNSAGSGVMDIAAAVGVALTATMPPPPTATPTGAPTRTPRPTSTRTPSSLLVTATATPRSTATEGTAPVHRIHLPALSNS